MDENFKPLDGGWAWMIVCGSGIMCTICLGYGKAFALIYPVMLQRFEESDFNTSLVMTICIGFVFFSGPIAGVFANMFNHRKVVIAGALVVCIGMVISAYASTLSVLYFSYGALVGLGHGLVIGPSFTMVIMYFKKKRGIAIGLSTVAGSIGGVIVTPLVAWLLKEYGYTGTLIVVGGLFLNICIAGALFRPLGDNYTKKKNLSMCDKIPSLDNLENGKRNITGTKAGLIHRHKSSNVDLNQGTLSSLSNLEITPYGSTADITEKSIDTKERIQTAKPVSGGFKKRCLNFVTAFDVALLKNLTFVLFILTLCSVYFSLNICIVFLYGYAREKGFSQSEVTILIVILNICDGVFRLGSGIVFDLPFIKKHILIVFAVLGMLQQVGFMAIAILESKIVLYILMNVTFGLNGALHSQHSNVLGCIVEPARLTAAYGIMRFIVGFAVIMAPAIGGALKDATGYYCWCYMFAGSVGFLPFLVFTIQQWIARYKSNKDLRIYHLKGMPQTERTAINDE